MSDTAAAIFSLCLTLCAIVVTMAAYFQHIVTCVKHEAIFTLVAGCLLFPIAILHGIGIWLGIFAG